MGDIIAEDPSGAPLVGFFNIELKAGYSKTKKGKRVKNVPWDILDIIDYIDSKNRKSDALSQVEKFWEQTERDAKLTFRRPLLVFKRDFHVPCVCIHKNDYFYLSCYIGECGGKFIEWGDEGDRKVIFRRDVFFEWLPPKIIETLYNHMEKK